MSERPKGATVTILVVHRADEDATAMMELLEQEVARGNAVEHLTLAVDGSTGADAALWRAHRAGYGSSGAQDAAIDASVGDEDGEAEGGADPLLFERLADIGRIERLRMVAVTTLRTANEAAELDRAMLSLSSTAARLLGADRSRTHARLAVLGYGEPMVSQEFFSSLADVNVAVLPYDRLEDASIARPVERTSVELFHAHGSVEIASACGLWRTMGDAPLDELRGSNAGGSVPRVRFLQSRVRLLRTPPMPVTELVAERRELPVPDGLLPAPDAVRLMPRLADVLVPPELTYEPAPEPRYESQSIAAGALARMLGMEVLHSLVEMPRLLWRSFGGEVSTLTRDILQQAVGEGSRYRVTAAVSPGFGLLDGEGRPVDVATVVAEPEVLAHFDPIPGDVWNGLVAEVLGSIDGDPESRDLREAAFGDARFLPVERSLLLGGLRQLPPRLVRMLEPRVGGDLVAELEMEDGPEEPEVATIAYEPPSPVSVIEKERDVTDRLVLNWPRIADVAGGLWNGARATYRIMRPLSYAGGILTLLAEADAGARGFHAKRASSRNFVEALLHAIDEVLEEQVTIHAVQGLEELEGWEPMLHDLELARHIAGTEESAALDTLIVLAGLDAVPSDASEIRHEAMGPDDLDRLATFVETELQAEFLRDYATHLRDLANEQPPLPPPSGTAIGGLDAPILPNGSLPGPMGAPLSDIPPPMDEFDDDLDDVQMDPLGEDWGLLIGIRERLVEQRRAAEADVERIREHLRSASLAGPTRVAVSPAVPAGAGIGLALLLIWFGQSGPGTQLISSLGLTAERRDAIFTLMTLILILGATTLTELGKRMSAQARAIVLAGGSVLVTSGVLVFFGALTERVPTNIRESNLLAFSLGTLAFAMVLIALLQSLASGDPVRIRGSRILMVALALYAILGIIVWQVQARAGILALEVEDASRVGRVLMWTAAGLLVASVAVLAVVRFRAARLRDDDGVRERWAVEHIGLAVDARERLRAAERQWTATMIAIAQVLRQPFGPIRGGQDDVEFDAQQAHALKAASVQVRLTDRGRSDLEARIRQMLIGPSWLRRRYQTMVDAYQLLLSTRLGVPVRNLADRRPEGDPTVPSELDLRTGRGRGDRMEFIRLAASGAFDASLAVEVERLDVRTVFEPMLAAPESHVLDGFETRAETVDEYFQQLLPESPPTLPNDSVTTVLAANDRRRFMDPKLWWPKMLPEPEDLPVEEGREIATTDMFRHGTVGGAGLVAVRVDVSQEFPYTELANASTGSADRSQAAEQAADYGSDVGL